MLLAHAGKLFFPFLNPFFLLGFAAKLPRDMKEAESFSRFANILSCLM